jgi:ATP-dependent Clp protease ATP-binding subunit ClpB
VAAATLSDRYITERFLPDKAIDLVDEAAAKLRTEMDSSPAELDEAVRRQMQLEIEIEGLKKEKDPSSRERLRKNPGGAGRSQGKYGIPESTLESEKSKVGNLQALRGQLEQARHELEKAEREYKPE